MIAQRTLASRGFTLPHQAATFNIGRWGGRGEWRADALRHAIRDFLNPSEIGRHVPKRGSLNDTVTDLIDFHAHLDGFAFGESMSMRVATAWQNPQSAQMVAAWLGIPVPRIWPHHAHASAKVAHAMRNAPSAMPVAGKSVEANTTLMRPVYSLAGALCNPFVHPVAKRVISFAGIVGAGALLIIGLRRGGGDIA